MAEDYIRQCEQEYLETVKLRAKVEHEFSQEFLLAKTQEVTDRVAEHMATVKFGEQLASTKAMEQITKKRLDRASESTA